MDNFFSRLFTRKNRNQATRKTRKAARQPVHNRPSLELLEDRLAPAVITYVWTNADNNGSWADNANWTNGGPSTLGAGNTAILQFNSGTAAATPAMTDDLTNPYAVNEIHFDATGGATSVGYTINGTNTIDLGAAAGIVVDSGFGVAASNAPVTFGPNISFALTAASAITNNDLNTVVTLNGAINLGTGLGGHTLTVVGGLDVTLSGVISGSGSPSIGASSTLVLNSGSLTLNGTNTYTNPTAVTPTGTTVNGGTLFVGNSSALGAAANTETVTGSGEIGLFNGASPTMTGALTLNNGGLFGLSASNTWTGPITLTPASTDAIGSANGGTLGINGTISGGNAASTLSITGAGTTEFKVNNTYVGETIVDAGNTLQIDAPSGLGAGGPAPNETLVGAGGELVLAFTGTLQDAANNAEQLILAGSGNGNSLGALQVLGGFSPTVSGSVQLGGTATIGVGTGTLTISGVISPIATTSLTYDDDGPSGSQGKIVVTGANTYNSPTDIGGSTPGQTGVIVNIQNNTALGVAGTPGNTVTVEDGAALQTQGSLGTIANNLVFNNLETTAGGDFPTAAAGSLEDVSGATTFSGTVTLNNATSVQTTISVDATGAGNELTLSGAIQGPHAVAGSGGGIIKVGPGTLLFTGSAANTYGGSTTVNAGTLELDKTASIIAVPLPTVAGGGLFIGLPNPNTAVTPGSAVVQIDQDNSIGTSVPITINPAGKLFLNGHLQTTGPLNITGGEIAGPGTLTLNGDVTATSFVDVNGNLDQASITAGTINLNVAFGGGTRTFDVTQTVGNALNPTPTGPPSFFADLFTDSIFEDGSATSVNVLKTGNGEFSLSGNNTYTGTTEVANGILFTDQTTTGFGVGAAAVTVDSGASIGLNNSTLSKPLNLNGVGFNGLPEVFTHFDNGPSTLSGKITLGGTAASTVGADPDNDQLNLTNQITGGTFGLSILDTGTVEETNGAGTNLNNNYGGPTTVGAGATLILDRQSTVGTDPSLIAVPGDLDIFGTVNVDGQVSNGFEIATTSNVTVEATGTLNLDPTQQTIASLTGVAGGAVNLITSPLDQLTVTGAINISGVGTFTVTGDGSSTNQFVTSGNTVTVASGSTLNLAVGVSGTGFTEVGADLSSTVELSGTARNLEQTLTDSSGTLLLAKTAAFAADGSSIAPGSASDLIIGSGAATPGSAVVRDSVLPVAGGNNWQLGGISTVGSGVNVSILQDGVLDLNGHMDRIDSLTMSGGTVSLGGGTLFMDGQAVFNPASLGTTSVIQGGTLNLDSLTQFFTVNTGANALISATIPNGGVDKLGTGPLTLTANNTYTGPTTIGAGTLFVNGTQGSSPVTVQSGGTLSGNGTVGPLTVNSGGTVAPLTVTGGPSLLSVQGGATLQSGAIFNAVLNSTTPGSGFSVLSVTGAGVIQAGDTLNVTVNNAFPAGTTFQVIQAGSLSGTFTSLNVTPSTLPITQFDNGTALILTIQLSSTSATVTAPSSSVFEQPVTLSSTVTFAPGTVSPGGTVQFFDNTGGGPVPIGSAQPVTGPAYNAGTHSATVSITVPTLTSGVGFLANVITAVYSGDSMNAGTTSTFPATVDVSPASTTLTFTAPPTDIVFEQPNTVTAQVSVSPPSTGSPTVPTGVIAFTATNTVTFQVTNLGTLGLNGNLAASVSESGLPPGSYTISAVYTSGNTNDFTAPASGITAPATVTQAQTTTTLTSPTTASTVSFNQSIPASATVSANSPSTGTPTPPTGFVTFTATPTVGAPVSQTVGLNGTSATTTFNLPPGSYTITATYLGDTNFAGSGPTAASPTQTVTTASTSVVLASSANPAAVGSPVTFTTTVTNTAHAGTNPAPDGTVEMFDGLTDIGPAHLVASNGNATTFTFTTSSLSLATTHAITAHYTSSSGDFANGTSNIVTEVIQPAVSAFILTTGGSVSQVTPSGIQSVPTNPGPGVVVGVSAVTDGTGHQVLYGIESGTGDLWQFSSGSWSEISTGLFAQVSAATNAQGQAVVFGVLGPNSLLPGTLWEQNPAAGTGLNAGWFEISSAPFLQVSAVGTPAGEVAYGILSPALGQPFGASLWRYDASQNPGHVVNAGWNQESSGQFAMVSAGRSGSQAIVFGILSSASALPGTLWSQNPAFGTEGLNSGWEQLSGSGPFPAQFSAVAAEANSTNGSWFGISGGQVFGHTSTINGELTPALPASAVQLSATHTPAGTDEVFATLVDGELWEFQAGVGASPAGWELLLAGGVDATTAP